MDFADVAESSFEPFPESALDGSIVDRFDFVVRQFPSRLAIRDATQSLTYSDLSSLAARIAISVQAATNEQEGPIAIYAANNALYAAAVLGILAAGRGYVPMDADYPIERNRLIASHAGVAAVVTAADFVDQVLGLVPRNVPVVNIATARADPEIKLRRPGPKDLAHILYTSGSTGVPKGVYQNHQGCLYAILQRTNTLHISKDDRLALFHSPSTVDGARVTLAALLSGASLHVLPPSDWSLAALAKQMRLRGITVCHSVPIFFRHLARALPAGERFDSIRIVHLSGERVDWNDFRLVQHCCRPGARLMVALGSTESCASYIQWFVDESVAQARSQLPIGREVAEFRLTIVDQKGKPVHDGELGEIVVSSSFIALGYWRDPQLTAGVFAVDATDPELRILKTGDLGRRRPDGLIDFLGRKDSQIKLGGNRIELAEIESAIATCGGVRDVAVLVRRRDNGEPFALVAYIAVSPGVLGLLPRHIQSTLARRLPRYMIPSQFIMLGELPRLSNFKIDRTRLTALDAARPTDIAFRSPSDDHERALLTIWQQVLNLPKIGIDDDFFQLGGDSLQALVMFAEIEAQLGYSLSPTTILQAPSIAQLAQFIRAAAGITASQSPVPLRASGADLPLFLVSGRALLAMYYRHLVSNLKSDRPVFGLQPPPLDGKHHIPRTVESMAAEYIIEIRRVQPHGPYSLAGHSFGGRVCFEMAQQLVRAGERVSFLGLMDTGLGYPRVEGRPLVSEAIHVSRRIRGVDGFQDLLFQGVRYIRNALLDLWIRQGRSIPHEHRAAYYEWLCTRASLKYVSKPYPGHITMFSAAGSSEWQRANWAPLARGGLTVLEVPAGHVDMVLPPHSKLLAEHFDACLDAAVRAEELVIGK